MAPPSEVILTSSSSTSTASGSTTLHDFTTAHQLATLKPSAPGPNSTAVLPTANGLGGICITVQEGKALAGVWAWQKEQLHQKIPLPEKLTCFAVSPTGTYCAGGTQSGHVYLWELASGLLFNSFDAHYRRVNILKFTQDGLGLVSGSDDSGVSVWSVASLVSNDHQKEIPTAYCTLSDHTLPVTDIQIGLGAFPSDCRVLTSSVDHTVKLWSLTSPASLLSTYHLPAPPTSLIFDPLERAFWAASGKEVFAVNLYERRAGEEADDEDDMAGVTTSMVLRKDKGKGRVHARGGGGVGEVIRIQRSEGAHLTLGETVTSLGLSLSASHLLIGSAIGQVHVHALPSLQHLRTLSPAAHKGCPVTHISTMLRPADLHGHVVLGGGAAGGGAGGAQMSGGASATADAWPIRPVGMLERMRVGRKERERHEVLGLLSEEVDIFSLLPPSANPFPGPSISSLSTAPSLVPAALSAPTPTSSSTSNTDGAQVTALEAEVARLKADLAKAKALNDKMWEGVVNGTFKAGAAPAAAAAGNGKAESGGATKRRR